MKLKIEEKLISHILHVQYFQNYKPSPRVLIAELDKGNGMEFLC